MSKRQDWCLEASADIIGVIDAIIKYTIKTRQLDANILRDSSLQRIELLHFQAYIHACAAMWSVAFDELRALTNSSSVELNPLELSEVYDKLWEMGSLLQSEGVLGIFHDGYRPWEKKSGLGSFYSKREEAGSVHEKRWQLLCEYESREDSAKFVPLLKKVLSLFGEGIHESLKRTMSDYLEATNGKMAGSKMQPWMKARIVTLVAHNNHAERPFAVIKLFDQLFQTMTLSNLSGLSHARCNQTYRPEAPPAKTKKTAAKEAKKAGAAVLADKRLRSAVSIVCSVRKRKINGKLAAAGEVTRMVRENREKDSTDSGSTRKQKREAKFKENRDKKVRKAEKADKANTVVLVETEAELGQRLQAMRNKTSKSTFLSRQVAASIDGRKFTYPTAAVPNKYRSEKIKDKNTGNKKIKRSPSSGDEVVYLNELVVLMIKEDIKQGRYSGAAAGAGSSDKTLARQLPVISDEYTSAYSQKLKMEEREETAQLWDIDDDDDLVEITDKYVGEIFYDYDEDETYRVVDVQYDEKKKKDGSVVC